MNEEERIEKTNAEPQTAQAESLSAREAGIEKKSTENKLADNGLSLLGQGVQQQSAAITEQPKTEQPKLQTKDMEVHHHPHIEKKSFKEYLFEGLMIFIAVTMGFFAENIREHFADARIEKEYLSTYKQQLLINKEQLLYLKDLIADYKPVLDSLADLFFQKNENKDLITTSRIVSKSKVLIMTTIDTDAYQQLVNSGGFKYIHNVALKDTMARYADAIKEVENINSFLLNYIAQNNVVINSLEDWHDFHHDHVEITPYPELTERERRLMVAYNKTRYQLAASSELAIQDILPLNGHILEMVNKELDR